MGDARGWFQEAILAGAILRGWTVGHRRPQGAHRIAAAELMMQEPLQISFHNMESSDTLERRVREHWAKVERHYDGIISARIVIEAPHKQPHKSSLAISISIGVPGRDIVVKREQRLHESDDHATWVVNEAFQIAERQLEDYAQKQRRDVKAHEGEREYARIARLYPDQDYGFIETARPAQHLLPSRRAARRGVRRPRGGQRGALHPRSRRRPDGTHGEQRLDARHRPPGALSGGARRPLRRVLRAVRGLSAVAFANDKEQSGFVGIRTA